MRRFRVFSKGPDAGWSRDWYWESTAKQDLDQHGPYPFRLWAWLAAWWGTR